jgi:hypothetical protein
MYKGIRKRTIFSMVCQERCEMGSRFLSMCVDKSVMGTAVVLTPLKFAPAAEHR